MFHRIKNYGIKCFFCSGLGHSEDKCWKKPKDGKSNFRATIFLEILLNDRKETMQELNKLCRNDNVFSFIRMLRGRMHVELALGGIVQPPKAAGEGT